MTSCVSTSWIFYLRALSKYFHVIPRWAISKLWSGLLYNPEDPFVMIYYIDLRWSCGRLATTETTRVSSLVLSLERNLNHLRTYGDFQIRSD